MAAGGPHANHLRSYLGQEYKGLKPSPTSRYNNAPREGAIVAVEEEPILAAPITPDDVRPILDLLAQCPAGPLALRVFQQHPAGLCWQDSIYMMLFNQEWFRPFLLETIALYMERFFELGHTDLIYAVRGTTMQVDYRQWVPGVNIATLPMVEVETRDRAAKLRPLAQFLQTRIDLGLPLAFWEYFTLALHRYILLGYLFLRYPETGVVREGLPLGTALKSRRKSISHLNYSKLHTNFKEVFFREFYTGMHCESFARGLDWFRRLTDSISGSRIRLLPFSTPDLAPASILGYYLRIHAPAQGMKHVISFFKCGRTWFMYDIDIGMHQFTEADTAVIEASKLSNVSIQNRIVEGEPEVTTYTVTFENGTSVAVSTPTNLKFLFNYNLFLQEGSYVLVQAPPAGGRRRLRRRHTRVKRIRHRKQRTKRC